MLFDSSLRKELQRSLTATIVVILTIVLTMMLIRTLGQAAGGALAAQDVILVMVYVVMGYIPLILSLSLFVATIATFTRLYRDSEMAVWFSSGVDLKRFIRPVLRTALPALVIILVTALWARPWGQQKITELKIQHEQRSDLSKVVAGEFQSSRDGRRVFYIDRNSPSDTIGRNVFVLSNAPNQEAVITAKEGKIIFEENRRMLALTAGERTARQLETGVRSNAQFETAEVFISESKPISEELQAPRSMPTLQLLSEDNHVAQAELAWRLGMVLCGVNLLLLGIGLAKGGPRQSNNWSLLIALLCFVIYLNLINLIQSWSGDGRIGPWISLLMLHGMAFIMAMALLWWRQQGSPSWMPWQMWSLLAKKKKQPTGAAT